MVIRPDDVAQAADVRVVQQGDDGRLPCRPNLLGVVVTLLLRASMVGIVSGTSRDDLARDLLAEEGNVSITQDRPWVTGAVVVGRGDVGRRM